MYEDTFSNLSPKLRKTATAIKFILRLTTIQILKRYVQVKCFLYPPWKTEQAPQDQLGLASFFVFQDLTQTYKGPVLSCSSKYWTSPSTTSEIRTVVRGAASPTTENGTLSAPNHRYRVFLTVFLRHKTFSRQDFRSSNTWPASTPIAVEGLNSELCLTASAAAIVAFNMLIPVSEKKFFSVNMGLRTNS